MYSIHKIDRQIDRQIYIYIFKIYSLFQYKNNKERQRSIIYSQTNQYIYIYIKPIKQISKYIDIITKYLNVYIYIYIHIRLYIYDKCIDTHTYIYIYTDNNT